MRIPTVAVASLTLLIVGLVVFVDSAEPSPGPLSQVHDREARLTARGGCVLCHGDDTHSLAEACLQCHELQAKQIADGRGVHGRLGDDVKTCGRCHSEHHGADFEPVAAASFVRAGIDDIAHFDHAGLQYDLAGKHATLACTACHEQAEAKVLPPDGKRFAGLDQACATCHDDPHHGKLPDCAACHGQTQAFALVPEFVHIEAFPLAGAHAGIACKRCHEPQTRFAIENSAAHDGRQHATVTARGCSACHDQPHDAAFVATVATTLASGRPPAPAAESPGSSLLRLLARLDTPATPATPAPPPSASPQPIDTACARCHPIEPHGFTAPVAKMTDELHQLTGFALTKPHAKLACEKCHPANTQSAAPPPSESPPSEPPPSEPPRSEPPRSQSTHTTAARSTFRARFPGRSADACAACHGDPHGGQFAATQTVRGADDCTACHTRHEFKPAQFDRARHAQTSFPLQGAHADLDCAKCHQDPAANTGTPRRFRGTPSTCVECHRDPHGGQFAVQGTTDCARCHQQTHFTPTDFDITAHARTTFPLTGAHAAVACAACHVEPAPNAPRRYDGVSTACSGCHQDLHKGRFDRQPDLRTVAGETGCARCHGTSTFSVLRQPFDHDRWTDHPLHGAHRTAKCADCHTGKVSNPAGLAAAPKRCDACHSDPHAAQFRIEGHTDCARCHDDGGKFHEPHFDHAKTRFPLDKQHADLACAACHKTYPVNGAAVVRYRPLGTQCADCHGPLGRKGSGR